MLGNVSVITSVPIEPGRGGASYLALSIAKQLYLCNKLSRVICPSWSGVSPGIPEHFFCAPMGRSFYTVLNICTSLTGRFLPLRQRRIREEIFDFLVSRSATLRGADTLLFLKPCFPKTVGVAKRRGIRTIGWGSILHPKFNFQQVRKEQKRFGIKPSSDYTDARRVRNLCKYFSSLDHLIVCSELAEEIFVKYGVDQHKVHLLKCAVGVDCRRFSPREDVEEDGKFRLLHISHMDLIKGVGYLLKAWRELELRDAELILGGNMSSEVKKVFRKICPSNSIHLGAVSNAQDLYKKADVFVSPSVSDALPNTILEAMACGVPVIASNMCGLSAIIDHGKDGFIYQYDDVLQLKKLILWCYENRNRLKGMGKAARRKALLFQERNFASRIVAAISQISL